MPLLNLSTIYFSGLSGISTHRRSQRDSASEMGGRFGKTLRQVIFGDYMAVIEKIMKRIGTLEDKIAQCGDRTDTRVLRYTPELESVVLEQLQRKISNLSNEMNKRMHNVDEDITTILKSNHEVR